MKYLLHLALIGVLACNLVACGHKGKLKSPSQIQAEEEKEARRAAKKAEQAKQEAAEKAPEAQPSE